MREFLRSFWSEPRVPGPPERMGRDWALVAVVVVASLLETTLREDLRWQLAPLLAAALAPGLLWRRSHPFAVVVVVFAVIAALDLAVIAAAVGPVEVYSFAYVLLLLYALFRWASGRHALFGLGVMLPVIFLGVLANPTGLGDFVMGLVFFFLIAELGILVRTRGNARRREIEQVKLRERQDLARELHDAVAHHVSAIAVQAQAGVVAAATNPEAAVAALRVIEGEASRTLTEMRTMVGILREGGEPDLAPQRGAADIARLARATPGAPTIAVALAGDLDGLGPSVGAAIYRLAQESITNAIRHAGGATRIDVLVEADESCVRLTVVDDGDARPPARSSSGYGLLGMTERATLLGGSLQAGPSAERGWTVTAVLPKNGKTR